MANYTRQRNVINKWIYKNSINYDKLISRLERVTIIVEIIVNKIRQIQ
jgi:hypothetical protein